MHLRTFVTALAVAICAFFPPSTARDVSCDDTSELSSTCHVPSCSAPLMLALRRGCFECVHPQNCFPLEHDQMQGHANPSDPIAVSYAENDHAGEQGIELFPQGAAVEAILLPADPSHAAMANVSNWYFLIPACLALVSMGIALRQRMATTDIEFERVDGEDQDEINPFCADAARSNLSNPQADDDDDDGDLEYGKPRDSDDE